MSFATDGRSAMLFGTPTKHIRKTVGHLLPDFDSMEEMAKASVRSESPQHQPYQIGIILILLVKFLDACGEVQLDPTASRRIQDIYASCLSTVKGDSYRAFSFVIDLLEGSTDKHEITDLYVDTLKEARANCLMI
jgi:hypothetical protein